MREVLPNGIRLLTVSSGETRAMTAFALVGVGSRHEPDRLAGAAHFIEHMLFKGTRRWKTPGRISRSLDAVGADYNAFTSAELTEYYVRLRAEYAPLAIDMLHGMLAEPLFAPKELERERGVILEEIAMYEDSPSSLAAEGLGRLLYRCGLGRNIAGTRGSVSRMTRKGLLGFMRRHYAPSRIVIVLTGNVPDGAVARARQAFGAIRRPQGRVATPPCGIMSKGGPRLAMRTKETEQVHAAIGFPGLPYGHKDRPALTLLTTVLGYGMSSRLFTEIRERRGLAYAVSAGMGSYSDVGDLTVRAGFGTDKAEEGIRTIMRELGKLARSGITAAELKRAKAYLEGILVLDLDSAHDLGESYGRQELFSDRIRTIDERIARIESVTSDRVRAVAKRLIRTSKLSVSIVGPFEDEAPFMKLLKIPYG